MLKFNKVGGKEIQKFPHILIPFYAKHQEMQNSMFMKTHLIHSEKTLETYLPIKTTNTFTLFIFLCVWHLFPGHKFLFLQFLLGYLFLLGNLLLWFRNNLFFSSEDNLHVAGRACVWIDLTVSSLSPAPQAGGFVHLDVLNEQRIYI